MSRLLFKPSVWTEHSTFLCSFVAFEGIPYPDFDMRVAGGGGWIL